MDPEKLRQLLHHREPFKPLRIHTDDGCSYEVYDPTSILAGPIHIVIGTNLRPDGMARNSVIYHRTRVVGVEDIEADQERRHAG